MTAEQQYLAAGRAIPGAEESQMFGKPCFKTGGKAFTSLFDNCMVFKLEGSEHERAMALSGSRRFDPSGRRPLKQWVQVSFAHHKEWESLARSAYKYVKALG